MSALTITLPDALREFVESQATKGGYGSAGDYVKELIRRAEADQLRAAIDEKLLRGIESLERGEGREITAADWERKRERLRQQMENRS